MKLKNKIFISILSVSLATLFFISYYLINQNHLDNIAREQERSVNEMELIQSAIESSTDISTTSYESLKLLLSKYGEYYMKRDIYLSLYHGIDMLFSDFVSTDKKQYNDLLTVTNATSMVQIIRTGNEHYILSSHTLGTDEYILIYGRSIEEIYLTRDNHLRLTLLLSVALILILSLLSYVFSHWITKPIDLLKTGANAISHGDYSVRITGTKDEFNELASAYNKMASAIEENTKALEDKAKELQTFIDDLSHEMNTPLTSIQGYSEFLLNANASEEQRLKAADTIRLEAVRMKDIYTKLLMLTLAREQDPEITLINVNAFFDEIKSSFQPMLHDKMITFDIITELETFQADHILMHMLICNLIKNSIQAVKQEGHLLLRAYKENGHTVLEVSDDGCGIPKETINDVFKPFFRVDKSRSRKTGGAGLGLSICKSIAVLHHANLVTSSELGKGTTVSIIFQEQ